MFRRLKEKISEEVKQSSLAQYSPFKDDSSKSLNQDLEATTSKQEPKNLIDLQEKDENQSFSIGDDDGLCSEPTSPTPTVPMFENVDLSDISSGSRQRRRTSSIGSSSSLFPAYNPTSFTHNIQSDLESASEVDESAVNLDVVSKEQLFSAFQKAKSRYLKYKTRYADVVKAYRDQVNENGKVKTILTESQDKALRRISELKEQSQLDQKAKIDLEENFRLTLEEKDEVLRVLQTQVRLLKSGINPVDDNNDALSNSSSTLAEDESKSNDDVQPDATTKLRLQEDTINKLKNLLKSCKETITKEKEAAAQLVAEKDALASKLDETESKLKEILDEKLLKEQSFDEELKRAAEKIDLFKQREEDHALNLAESKRLMHEEMETREKSLQELKLQLQQLNCEKETFESILQEKSKLISELEETKHDNLDKSKQQLIKTEEALEEEKQNLLQEMSRGKAAALQLLQQETEKRILLIQKEKSDSDLAWKEKLDAVKSEYEEVISSDKLVTEQSLNELNETREKYSIENRKLKEVLEQNRERFKCFSKSVAAFKAANNELCLDLAILNENQVAACKELRQELVARIENVFRLEIEKTKEELTSNHEREMDALRKQLASVCENNTEFQRVIEELSDTKQSLEERLESATNLAKQSEADATVTKERLEEIVALKVVADEELSRLLEENRNLERECEVLRSEKSDSDAEIVRLSSVIEKNDDIEQTLTTLRAELESKDDDNLAKLRRIEAEAAQQLDEVCTENERVCFDLRQSLELERNKVAELNSTLVSMKRDNDDQLLEVNQRLALELDNMRNATESLKCEVDATREQLSASKSEYAEHIGHLNEQIQMKENQLLELLGAGDMSQKELMSQLEKMRQDYDALSERKFTAEVQLKEEYNKLRMKFNESFAVLRDQLVKVRKQLNDDRNVFATSKSEYSALMESLKETLQSEKDRNETQLKLSHDEIASEYEERIQSFVNQVTKLEQSKTEIEEELERCRKLLSEKEDEVTNSSQVAKELKQEVNTLRSEKEKLEQQLLDMKDRVSKSSDELKQELETHKEDAKQLKEQINSLESELQASKSVNDESSALLFQLRKDFEEKETEHEKDRSEHKTEMENLKKVHKDKVNDLHQRFKTKMKNFSGKNAEKVSAYEAKVAEYEKERDEVNETNKNLEAKVKELQTENSMAKFAFDTLLGDCKAAHLLELNEQLETVAHLTSKISDLQFHFDRISSIETESNELKEQLVAVSISYEELKLDYEKENLKRKELEGVVESLDRQIEELLSTLATKEKERVDRSTEEHERHKKEFDETMEKIKEENDVELCRLREELKDLTVCNEELKQDYERENSKRQELVKSVCDLKESLAVLSTVSVEKDDVVASLELQIEELRSALRSKETEAEELRFELREQKKHSDDNVTRINEENQDKLNDLKKKAEKKLAQIKKQMQLETERIASELQTKIDSFVRAQAESEGIRQQSIEETISLEVRLKELQEKYKTETECLGLRCLALESEKENLLTELEAKNSQIDESLITAQINHMESTKKLQALEFELDVSRNRFHDMETVVDDLRRELLISEQERSVLTEKLEEQIRKMNEFGAKEEEDGELELRETLRREYEAMLKVTVDDHAVKIKQLTREFGEMIAEKEEEGREALANAVEQSLNDDNRIRRDHAKQIESIGRELSERESNLVDELKRRDERIKVLESDQESIVRNCEEKLSTFQAEQRQQTDAIEKKWKALMKRELQEREEAYREEIEGLSEEWQMERKFPLSSNSVELNSQELQKQTKLATSVVESGGYSSELLRRQVMTMQSQLQMMKERHRDEVEQLKETLRSRNCPIPHFDESRYSSNVLDQRLESLETEYLKNILFEYMMGRETLTLAKVIAAVVRFSDEQTSKVLEREEGRSSGVSGQLVHFLK